MATPTPKRGPTTAPPRANKRANSIVLVANRRRKRQDDRSHGHGLAGRRHEVGLCSSSSS